MVELEEKRHAEWQKVEEEEDNMFNKKVYPNILLNIVSVHGVYSSGKDLVTLCDQVSGISELSEEKVKISIINYGTLLLTLERIPFVRNLIVMIIANRLAACSYKYPNAKTMVIAHSFGTWATCEALKKWGEEFRLNCLILFGSVVSRKFKFDNFLDTEVHNIIGKRDFVVLSSALWGTGWSGFFGFKKDSKVINNNLKQYNTSKGHSGYKESYSILCDITKNFVSKNILHE